MWLWVKDPSGVGSGNSCAGRSLFKIASTDVNYLGSDVAMVGEYSFMYISSLVLKAFLLINSVCF